MAISQILTKDRLVGILGRFSQVRAGVIGDLALDAYWFADMTRARLSRETPHYPRPVVSEAYSPGAGGNVAQNLAALGVSRVMIFSVLGEDIWSNVLRDELDRLNISTQGLLSHPRRRTTAYIKPILIGYDSRQEDARLDFENTLPLDDQAEEQLLTIFKGQLGCLDCVLISDQLEENGIITPRLRARLAELARSHSEIRFFADSRLHIHLFPGMVLKPNRLEALAAWRPRGDLHQADCSDLEQAGLALAQQSGQPVFLTLGYEGVLVCSKGRVKHIVAAPVRGALDTVGAGDTFFATLAASLTAGADPWEAGAIANLAAAVTVEKLNQTGTASPQEILERFDLATTAM